VNHCTELICKTLAVSLHVLCTLCDIIARLLAMLIKTCCNSNTITSCKQALAATDLAARRAASSIVLYTKVDAYRDSWRPPATRSRVWDKVPEGSTLILKTLNSLKTRGNPYANKSSAVAEMCDHYGHNRHGLKRRGAAVPLLGMGSWVPT